MVQPTRPPANGFVAAARKVYNPLGFAKGYNFVLFFIFFGAFMGFTLARFEYLNFSIFCGPGGAAPGECFYYQKRIEQIGIKMHLGAILPASFLACFQFVPVIRHKVLLFHRINGYLIILLSLVSTAGIFMFLRNAFGGGIETQTGIGLLSIMFIGSMMLAFINIKKLQIEQHRVWMLRAWFYVCAANASNNLMLISEQGRIHHHYSANSDHCSHYHQQHGNLLCIASLRPSCVHGRQREQNTGSVP